jgi:hypothetical protein
MCILPGKTGSDSDFSSSWEIGDSSEAFAGKDYYKDLIRKANLTPLPQIFAHYRLQIDELNKKSTCPLPSHKGGRERSASFYYYPETNTFWCFGCKTGTRACDFVAAKEKISRTKAAIKILELFENQIQSSDEEVKNYSEELEIMIEFSNFVREFKSSYTDEDSFQFVEKICGAYDSLSLKYELSNEALKNLTSQLKDKLLLYKEQNNVING